jgi:hypothetical protein
MENKTECCIPIGLQVISGGVLFPAEPVEPSIELRDDGGIELRDDGGIELRD